jgi:hypothetical protein
MSTGSNPSQPPSQPDIFFISFDSAEFACY